MNLYLLVMTGQGDTHVKLVTENIWKWIFSEDMTGKPKDANGWYDPTTPESVRQYVIKNENSISDSQSGPPDGLVYVTIGSYDNDKALNAGGDEVPYDEYGGSEHDAREWAKDNDHEIVGEWEGCIY